MDREIDQAAAIDAAVSSRKAMLEARAEYERDVLRARKAGVSVRRLAGALDIAPGSVQYIERRGRRA